MIERCLWTEAAPAPPGPAVAVPPDRTDVAIVGGGYTGLAAARALARRGVDVTVLERHVIGWGASSRNGGFVLPGFKPDVEVLARKLGVAEARRLFELSKQAVEGLEALVADEAIDCDYTRCGTIILAARAGSPGGARAQPAVSPGPAWPRDHAVDAGRPPAARSDRPGTTAACSTRWPARCSRRGWCRGSRGQRRGRAPGWWKGSRSAGSSGGARDGPWRRPPAPSSRARCSSPPTGTRGRPCPRCSAGSCRWGAI